jgi:hypothetical protein
MPQSDKPPEHWLTAARPHATVGRQICAGLLLMAFGGVFLYFLLPELLMNLRASGWPTASCTIIESKLASSYSSDTEETRLLFRADIRYSYEYGGQRYEATCYRFANPYTNDESAAAATVRKYPAGKQATCYVNSDTPEVAVLDRSISPYHLFTIIPTLFALLGLSNIGAALAKLSGRE